MVYSTYLGGSGYDYGAGIAVDASGNAHITGSTASSNFPLANAYQSSGGGVAAFVAKFNAAGDALIYSTYLSSGDSDAGASIAVDASGNAYITGNTDSTKFPLANAYQSSYGGGYNDAFVAKLNAAGNALVYSTYLGGNHYDVALGIAVDASGNAYITGSTYSTNFPLANAYQSALAGGSDAFVAKITTSGQALLQGLLSQVETIAEANRNLIKLSAPLKAANGSLTRSNEQAAINQLGAFIHMVEASVRSGQLSAAQGAELTGSANQIIATIKAG